MKKQVISICIAAVLLLSCALATFPAKAQARIIIVPDNYATIGDAINAAANGDTIFVRKGNYEGPTNQTLIMNKTLSLMGENKDTTKIHLNPPLIPMNIFTYQYMGYPDSLRVEVNGITISELTIEPLGGNIAINAFNTKISDSNIRTGIIVTGDHAKIVDNAVLGSISINGNYNTIVNSTIDSGIETRGYFNLIAGNIVSGVSGLNGITSRDNNTVIYNNTVVGGDFPAVQLDFSSRNCLLAKNNLLHGGLDIAAFTYFNTVCGNNLNGGGLSLMGFNNVFFANQLGHVGIGGTHGGTVDAAYNTFYHNNFVQTSPEFQVWSKQPGPLTWDNGYEGNYWSNYTGDGVIPYEIFAEFHYFDGALREDLNISLGRDIRPLLSPFDIETANIPLPEWAKMEMQNLPQLPTVTPTQTPTSSATANPTPTTLTNSPSPSSSSQQNPYEQLFPTTIVILGAIVVGAALLIYFKNRKKVKAI